MLKVQIKDASIDRATINGPKGSFTSERQTGWIELPSGETRKIRVRVKDGKAYAIGDYTIGDNSFTVGQYGDLQIGALELLPVNKPAPAPAQVR